MHRSNIRQRARTLALSLIPALASAVIIADAAHAAPIPDAAGDFLPTYTGIKGGDLDVLQADVALVGGNTFRFFAELNGLIGTTPGALYVWGLDRGAGTERFVAGNPSIGAGVFFDSVVILNADGTGSVNLFGLGGGSTAITAPILISGNTITADLPVSMFPSQGRALDQYGWNLWPRAGAGNGAISDFAPDASTPLVSIVPEPSTFGLLALGAVALVGRTRSRRRI